MNKELNEEKNVLYFSDLPSNVIQTDLEMFLEKYKDNIHLIVLNQNPRVSNNIQTLNAKVIFKDFDSANEVRREMNLRKIKGHSTRIMWDERDTTFRYNTKSNLFVKNIPVKVTPREVYEHFIQFGDISSAKLNEDDNGNHYGYAYITYYISEDADKAINETHNKEIWGVTLEVTHFQKKNERNTNYTQKLYINNFPSTYTKEEMTNLCLQYGDIDQCEIQRDPYGRPFSIVYYKNEEDTTNALHGLNNVNINGNKLFVQYYQNKYERKQFIETRLSENTRALNDQYQYCNLHIRNIPFQVTDDELRSVFEKFGSIKSLKIEKYILETKQNDIYKEVSTSKGFGYVCFDNQESAKAAIDSLNGRYLPKYESWLRPLIIEYFVPKNLRVNMTNQMSMGMGMGGNMVYYNNPQATMMTRKPYIFQPQMNMGYQPRPLYPQIKQPSNLVGKPSTKSIDMAYYSQLETDDAKRDFLGEQIFIAIKDSNISLKNNLTIDVIGRITGMIINIPDLNEVLDILKSETALYERINEALELLKEVKE